MRQSPGNGFEAAYAHHQAGRIVQAVTIYRRLRMAAPRDYRVLHVGGAALWQRSASRRPPRSPKEPMRSIR